MGGVVRNEGVLDAIRVYGGREVLELRKIDGLSSEVGLKRVNG